MDEPKNEIRKEDLLFGLDIGASKINLFVGVANGSSVRVLECGDFPLKNADEFDNVVETLKKAAQTLGRKLYDFTSSVSKKKGVTPIFKSNALIMHYEL